MHPINEECAFETILEKTKEHVCSALENNSLCACVVESNIHILIDN